MAEVVLDDEFEEEEEDGLGALNEDDNDVVFGTGPINKTSMVKFINRMNRALEKAL